ncbi:MAG: MATE family efflux transporter, partial [Gammaproteobacteria bacterium]
MSFLGFNYTSQILKLAVPFFLITIADTSILFFSTAFAGYLNTLSLAAIGLAIVTYFVFLTFCQGTLAAVGILCANSVGEGQPEKKLGIIFYAGLLLACLAAIV